MANQSPTYLDTPAAADRLGMKTSTLEAWRHRGGGPKYLKFGRAVRYRPGDLDEWVESRLRGSTSETDDSNVTTFPK